MINVHGLAVVLILCFGRCVKDFRLWLGNCVSSWGPRTATWHMLWHSAVLGTRGNSEETIQSRANWRMVSWNRSRCFACRRYAYFYSVHLLLHVVNGSEMQKVLFLVPPVYGFLFVYEISREPLSGFAPNSHRRRVSSHARMNLKVKVTTAKAFFGPFGSLCGVYVWLVNIFSL